MSDRLYVGVDVSAKELAVAVGVGDGSFELMAFPNDKKGRRFLIKRITGKGRVARVCLESTGVYGLDTALALQRSMGVDVMVANPRAARNFARAMMSRNKTDVSDSVMLAQFAARMPFKAWSPPGKAALELRSISRRIESLVRIGASERNRLHASEVSDEACGAVSKSVKSLLAHIDKQMVSLTRLGVKLIENDKELSKKFSYLKSVKGIAERSAIQILGELVALPDQMSDRQWVAQAGLDPRRCESGSSVRKPARLGKTGNRYLRKALYMPALVAIRYEPNVKAFYERLIGKGKKPLQAIVAVMRKLLVSIYGMFKNQRDFDGNMFCDLRTKKA